jgi:3-deoxy-7-phosphoheptulonate synthase
MSWSPSSWRSRRAEQLPEYPNPLALARAEARLASAAPLVRIADIQRLKSQLGRVASGQAFLLQGGDCAESFAEFGAEKVRTTYSLLLQMNIMLREIGAGEVVNIARLAGQFAKPRSNGSETIDGVTLPSYRGDIINGPAFDAASRTPDPDRMLEAYRQCGVTRKLLRAFSAAAYADVARFRSEARERLGLKGPAPAGPLLAARIPRIYTSHEALLLNYEQPLTRFDEESGKWWATSGHMLWIGDRTRSLDGAHIEYARGIANPIGLKCGPSLAADDLLRLIERLDPDNKPGRLVLIGRFGAEKVERHLPELMRATRRAGRRAIWSIDPMHGNTVTAAGVKTRFVDDIASEVTSFFEIAEAENVHARGVHLEMTGADVTECLGGSLPLSEKDLSQRYLTHCDPRLNRSQALDIAAVVAEQLVRMPLPASNAA